MKSILPHIISFVFLVFSLTGSAMSPDLGTVNDLNVQNGLAGESVFKIFKDNYGIIWIGTSNGLNSFNGYRLRTFNVTSNREKNTIYDIAKTSDGRLFVATPAGTFALTSTYDRFERVVPQSRGISHGLAVDGNTLYIGGDDGLYVYRAGHSTHFFINRDRMSENNVIKDLFVDSHHRVWLLGCNDLFVYDAKSHNIKSFNLRNQLDFIGTLRTVAVVGDKVFIGSDNSGLFVFDLVRHRFQRYVDVGCHVITDLSSDGRYLYVATDGNGAHVISLRDNRIVTSYSLNSSYRLLDNSVYCFYHDKSGVNWFGYFRRGVTYNYYSRPLFHVYSFGTFSSKGINVRSFCINGSQKLIGTRNGLYFIDEKSNVVKYFPPSVVGGSIVTSVCFYKGKYYVATYDGGVCILNPSTLSFSRFGNNPALMTGSFSKLLISPENELWMGGNQGIFVFNGNNQLAVEHYSQSNSQLYDSYVNNMMFDRQGRCWISTQKGLCMCNPIDKVIRSSGFPSGFINTISELNCTLGDHDEVICYSLAGLYSTNEDMTRYHSIKLDKTVWNNFISIVVYDAKYAKYWLGTENGLFCYDRNFRGFRHYGDEYNLPCKEFSTSSCLIDQNRNLWIGSLNGLVCANLDYLNRCKGEAFNISVDDITVDNEGIDKRRESGLLLKHEISLLWNMVSQRLSFKPLVLNYGNPDGNYFEYRINSEEKWNVVDDKSLVTSSNFHLGVNRIFLRVSGHQDIAQFKVVVYPSFWFIVELIVIVCIAVILRFMLRKRRLLYDMRQKLYAAEEAAENAKYSRVKMNDEELGQLYHRLTEYVETEKPYLDPSLRLSDIALKLDCSSQKLSQTLNIYTKQNYYDFINRFRLEEFKRRVNSDDYSRYTLTALSEQCGFKKSSFFSTFKKMMGITPAEYLHQIGKM